MFTSKNSDDHWECYGKIAPYFGVLSDEQYKSQNIDEEAREKFFASGKKHIEHVLRNIRDHLSPGFHPEKALDFGCGVARLVIPLSTIVEEVIGIDVSSSMIEEARKTCDEKEITNVHYAKDINELPANTEFDFIHS